MSLRLAASAADDCRTPSGRRRIVVRACGLASLVHVNNQLRTGTDKGNPTV